MATHWGYEGTVKVGVNAIAEIEEFSLNETVDPIVDTQMGDLAETHIAGSNITKWTAEVHCHWDETNTNGQEALTIGASVTLNMYPEGATTGDKFYSGLASITSIAVTVKKDNDTIKRTFSVRGNGVLTYAAAA